MESKKKLELVSDYIEKCKGKNILVIGDSILDEYVTASMIGSALETPETPKAKHNETKYFFGGAAGVVRNLLELGAKVKFITLLGRDRYSNHFNDFSHQNLTLISILEKDRATTVKRRFWVDGKKLLQLNHLDNTDLSEESKLGIIKSTKEEIDNSDLVLLIDYKHGMLTKDLVNDLKAIAKEKGKKSIASSQTSRRESNHKDYLGVDLICLNRKEALDLGPEEEFESLPKKFGSNFCITMGEKGSTIYTNKSSHKAEAARVEQKEDAMGAGDCFLAALSLSDFENKPQESLFIANHWAGLAVTLPGTQGPKVEDLIKFVGGA